MANRTAVIETNKGRIRFELLEADAPKTTENFITLAERGYKAGTVAMANAGPNTNGSQFFIMHADYPLPPSYTIFGRVTAGQDVVNAIATTQKDRNDRPIADVKMEQVTIESA